MMMISTKWNASSLVQDLNSDSRVHYNGYNLFEVIEYLKPYDWVQIICST